MLWLIRGDGRRLPPRVNGGSESLTIGPVARILIRERQMRTAHAGMTGGYLASNVELCS